MRRNKKKATCLSIAEIGSAIAHCYKKSELENEIGNWKACSDWIEQAGFWEKLMESTRNVNSVQF